MVRSRTVTVWIGVALLVAGAGVLLVLQPWHGPIVLPLTTNHGVDRGDLPALALLALAVGTASCAVRSRRKGSRGGSGYTRSARRRQARGSSYR
jgi:hypothetical protein